MSDSLMTASALKADSMPGRARDRRRRARGRRAAAAALAAVLALAGCSGIPVSGSVGTAEFQQAEVDLDVLANVAAPAPGAAAREILTGFFLASASPIDDYAVSREYLTTDLAATWDPNERAVVYSGRSTVGTDTNFTVTTTNTAVVDAAGQYQEFSPAYNLPVEFTMVQEDGEWRISSAPNGIFIDDASFYQSFVAQTLYFYDPSYQYLVPDVRWFPKRASLATSVVQALIAGPSDWLSRGVVVSAIPDGAQLVSEAVPVDQGTAEVTFSTEILAEGNPDWDLIQFQLQQSLGKVSNVSNVQIQVGQTDFTAAAAPVSVTVTPRVDPLPLVLLNNQFGSYSAGAVSQLAGISPAIVAMDPEAVTVVGDAVAAVLADGETYRVLANGESVQLDSRSRLNQPSMDIFGNIWSTSAAKDAEVLSFAPGADAEATTVTADWLSGSAVRSLQVSHEGARVLVVTETSGDFRVQAAGIIRDSAGNPTALTEPTQLAVLDTAPIDATWVDQTDIAVAVEGTDVDDASAETTDDIVQYPLGGPSEQLGEVADVKTLVGGNGVEELRILDGIGVLQSHSGGGWQDVVSGVTLLATRN